MFFDSYLRIEFDGGDEAVDALEHRTILAAPADIIRPRLLVPVDSHLSNLRLRALPDSIRVTARRKWAALAGLRSRWAVSSSDS